MNKQNNVQFNINEEQAEQLKDNKLKIQTLAVQLGYMTHTYDNNSISITNHIEKIKEELDGIIKENEVEIIEEIENEKIKEKANTLNQNIANNIFKLGEFAYNYNVNTNNLEKDMSKVSTIDKDLRVKLVTEYVDENKNINKDNIKDVDIDYNEGKVIIYFMD